MSMMAKSSISRKTEKATHIKKRHTYRYLPKYKVHTHTSRFCFGSVSYFPVEISQNSILSLISHLLLKYTTN